MRYIGEIADALPYLQRAAALVQTPRWFDCFPLVVIQALASATPVISLSAGGVPEQIRHGENGFLCQTFSDLVDAFRHVGDIDPAACRRDAETRFSDVLMADRYLELYRRAIEGERW